MKKINHLFLGLCATATFLSSACVGQTSVHFGLTTGFNSTFVLDKGLAEDPRFTPEPTYRFSPIGASFGADFGRGFGLQLESILSKQGQVYHILDKAEKAIGERRIELNYINLPLLLRSFSTGSSRTRFNFLFGPQLSLLTQGTEVYEQYQAGTLVLPEGAQPPTNPNTGQPVQVNADRTYDYPKTTQTLASTDAKNQYEQFKKMDLQVALGLGVDIDLGRFMYLSTQIRGNYGFLDMRNEDLVNSVKNNSSKQAIKDLAGQRANLLVGAQIGLHWMFGGNRTSGNASSGVPER